MIKNKRKGKEIWASLHQSQPYKIWTGYAFENLCQRHIPEIKSALGISGVYTRHYSFNQKADGKAQTGYQIDLIIDRKDDSVNLCECKFYNTEFNINREYASKLRNRRQAFIETTKTKKTVFNTLITGYGAVKNEYYFEQIDTELTVSDLMR